MSQTLFCTCKAGVAGEMGALYEVCIYLWRARQEAASGSSPGEGTPIGQPFSRKEVFQWPWSRVAAVWLFFSEGSR